MKKILIIAAMFVTMSAAAQTGGNGNIQPYENYVQVTGQAEREVVPNEIYVKIVIDESNTKGRLPVEKQEKDMIAALRRAGFDTDKVLTVDDMGNIYTSGGVLKKSDNRTSKTYQLKVGTSAELAVAFDAVESAGLSKMSISKTGHTDLKKIYAELRAEAMKNARAMADDLAGAVGQQAGRAIYIQDYNQEHPYISQNEDALYTRSVVVKAAGIATYDAGSSPEFKGTKLSYGVTAKFELK